VSQIKGKLKENFSANFLLSAAVSKEMPTIAAFFLS
jgi:hypothetical protein